MKDRNYQKGDIIFLQRKGMCPNNEKEFKFQNLMLVLIFRDIKIDEINYLHNCFSAKKIRLYKYDFKVKFEYNDEKDVWIANDILKSEWVDVTSMANDNNNILELSKLINWDIDQVKKMEQTKDELL